MTIEPSSAVLQLLLAFSARLFRNTVWELLKCPTTQVSRVSTREVGFERVTGVNMVKLPRKPKLKVKM